MPTFIAQAHPYPSHGHTGMYQFQPALLQPALAQPASPAAAHGAATPDYEQPFEEPNELATEALAQAVDPKLALRSLSSSLEVSLQDCRMISHVPTPHVSPSRHSSQSQEQSAPVTQWCMRTEHVSEAGEPTTTRAKFIFVLPPGQDAQLVAVVRLPFTWQQCKQARLPVPSHQAVSDCVLPSRWMANVMQIFVLIIMRAQSRIWHCRVYRLLTAKAKMGTGSTTAMTYFALACTRRTPKKCKPGLRNIIKCWGQSTHQRLRSACQIRLFAVLSSCKKSWPLCAGLRRQRATLELPKVAKEAGSALAVRA